MAVIEIVTVAALAKGAGISGGEPYIPAIL
jgi:hypothetical protein